MEEPDGKHAISSPDIASVYTLPGDHGAEATCSSRPTGSTVTADTAVDPVLIGDSIELPSRQPPPEESGGAPSVATKVPRSQRRGLFASITILPEVTDPYHQYSYRTKWFIVFVVAYSAAAAPMGSAIFFRTF
jgi:hypothetical protein